MSSVTIETFQKPQSMMLSELTKSLDSVVAQLWDLPPHGKRGTPTEGEWVEKTYLTFLYYYGKTWILCFGDSKVTTVPPPRGVPEMIKFIKNLCLTPMTLYIQKQDLEHWPFTGPWRRRAVNRLRTRNSTKKLLFCNTILQLKRVCPTVPKSAVTKALDDHKMRVTKEDQRQSPELIRDLQPMARLLVDGWRWEPEVFIQDFSLRACNESCGLDGGQYGYWQEKFASRRYRSVLKSSPQGVAFSREFYFPRRYEILPSLEEVETHSISAIGICEPLKVRVITLNPAWCSPFWADFQKSLMRSLRRRREMYSGEDLTPEHFSVFFRNREVLEVSTGGAKWVIVSDDASAATDTISPDLSASLSWLVADEAAAWLFRKTWTSYIYYKRAKHQKHDPITVLKDFLEGKCFRQVNGQMMGDRRSFPILCLLHMAMKLLFLVREVYPTFPKDRQELCNLQFFAVNGDDGVILLPEEMVPNYFRWMNQFWEINELKSYVSATHLSFNSQFWYYDGTRARQAGIFRWNLCLNNDKNGRKGEDPTVWNKVCEDTPQCFQKELFHEFLKHWSKEMAKPASYGCNWFLPHIVGGVGLTPPHGWEYKVTPRQNYAIAKARECLVTGEMPPLRTKKVKIGYQIRDRIIDAGPRRFQKKPEGYQEPTTGCFKSGDLKTILRYPRLPDQFVGRVPWEDLVGYGFYVGPWA
jgi:hypothetical protein